MSDRLEIVPLTKPPRATVRVPGSKSITNRALVLAALHAEVCYLEDSFCEGRIERVLRSEDTEVMVGSLTRLGYHVEANWEESIIRICREIGTEIVPASRADLFVGNSGTTVRFLTALVSLGRGRYRLDGVPRMRERPIEDLLDALRQLGVNAFSERGNGCPPLIIETEGWKYDRVRVKGNISSQFLSGLLMAASAAGDDILIEVDGPLVSYPYVAMTVEMMQRMGIRVEVTESRIYRVLSHRGLWRQQPLIGSYAVEPDASAASYVWAAAAITSGQICVSDLTMHSLQGDVRFVDLLEDMGCTVIRGDSGITVHGGPLRGIDVDMNDISDTVMTLAAVACFAEGPTTIRNVAHIRHKETDRLAALATELRRVGAEVTEFADGLTITPRPLHGAEIETYNDHRMAMSMALIGLRVPGIVIKNPGCVAKTYPHFFADLERLREEAPPQGHKEHKGQKP
jgi:3-phosphoshikimate 1-carboxyvinyltransferase